MKQYLESVDTITLFKKFIENPDLMRSKSLYSILKTASEMELVLFVKDKFEHFLMLK